jgi:DNA-binding CsgD family transcriptional regulator
MNQLSAELDNLAGDITEALEELPLPAFVLDCGGTVRWSNDSARSAVGDSRGRKWSEFVSNGEKADGKAFLKRVLGLGQPADVTLEIRQGDGSVATREISAAPLREGGAVVGLFGIAASATQNSGQSDTLAEPSSLLTKRQIEILHLLAQGKSTDQIATELVLTRETVRNHIRHVFARLGVHTRVQAVIAASRAGLIDLHPATTVSPRARD